MSKFLRLCCFFTIASTLTSSVLRAQQPREELIDPFADGNQPIEIPAPIPDAEPAAEPTMTSHSASATLRVFVDDGLDVFINDHPTTTPVSSGGSRLFTLTELIPSHEYPTIVKVRLQDDSLMQSEPITVEADNHYTVVFPSITAGAAENAGELITAGLVPSPMVGPIEQLQDESTWLAESTATLDDALGKLNTWKEKLDQSSETLRAAKEEIEAANQQFHEDVESANGKLEEATNQNLNLAKTTLETAANDLKNQLNTSTTSLTDSAQQLVESTQGEITRLKELTDRLEIVVNPLLDDGTPRAGRGAKRLYKLESDATLRATLSYNEELEISGIHFDASHLKDTINFVDGNEWNSKEVATEGVLTLRLQVRLDGGERKDFIPAEKYSETIKFKSHDDRTVKIRFTGTDTPNVKKWIEDTVAKNTDQTEKLLLNHNVTVLLIAGEISLGFADPAAIETPLEIEILK